MRKMVLQVLKKIKNQIFLKNINKKFLLEAYHVLKGDPETVYPKIKIQELFKRIGITFEGDEASFKDVSVSVPVDLDDQWGYRGYDLIFVLDKLINNNDKVFQENGDFERMLMNIENFLYLSI